MTEVAINVSDTVGPDDLVVPAEPARLRQAAEALEQAAQQLDRVHEDLVADADADEVRGATANVLLRVCRWNGRNAHRAAEAFRELAEVARQEAEVVVQARDQVDQLRSRWRAARQELFDEVGRPRGGPDAPHPAVPHPVRFVRRLDAELTEDHAQLFHRLTGIQRFSLDGGPEAVLVDAGLDDTIQRYRQTVRGVLSEFEDAVRRVQRVDRDLEERMVREQRFRAVDESRDGFAHDERGISGPRLLRSLKARLETGSRQLAQVAHDLAAIGNALDDGRLADHVDPPPRQLFQHSWGPHLERRVARLQAVAESAEDAIREVSRIDEEWAGRIRERDDEDD